MHVIFQRSGFKEENLRRSCICFAFLNCSHRNMVTNVLYPVALITLR